MVSYVGKRMDFEGTYTTTDNNGRILLTNVHTVDQNGVKKTLSKDHYWVIPSKQFMELKLPPMTTITFTALATEYTGLDKKGCQIKKIGLKSIRKIKEL